MVNTKTFNEAISSLKQKTKEKFIDINSGQLNKDCKGQPGTITTCCNAMLHNMLEEDEIIQMPSGKTGKGTRLTIRYYLHDLDTRKPIHEKKRGRPIGAKNTKTTQNILISWLEDKGLKYEIEKGNYNVAGEFGPWFIIDNRNNDLSYALHTIAKHYKHSTNKYSIMTKNETLVRSWKKISKAFKQDLNISLLFIDNNEIIEY